MRLKSVVVAAATCLLLFSPIANAQPAMCFSDNGIDIDTVILMVDNADDTFDLYLN